jgi:hypothetical protein
MAQQLDLFAESIPRKGEYLVPDGAKVTTYASCGASIVWTTTEQRRYIPLSLATVEEREGKRYALTHFSDCPHAREWRRDE